ncbi:MAG: hypothetical protein ACLRSW_06555 [Christensenellaceae bacterium]
MSTARSADIKCCGAGLKPRKPSGYFAALRRRSQFAERETAEELAFSSRARLRHAGIYLCPQRLRGVGAGGFREGRLIVYRGVKADLNASAIYRKICFYKKNDGRLKSRYGGRGKKEKGGAGTHDYDME